MRRFFSAVIFAVTFFAGPLSFADSVQFEVGAGMAYFAGDQYKSLAPKTGYLIRFGAGSGRKPTFKWVSNFTLLSSSGTTSFKDNGTNRELAYQLMAGEFNIGFKVAFLAPLDRSPIQPYFGAAGTVMSASFKFDENAAVSEQFPKTDAQNFYGYNIFVGADIEIGREWGMNLHVEQSKVSGTVAKQPFALDSNRVFLQMFVRY